MRALLIAAAAAVIVSASAQAQSNPNADQIINALKPKGMLSGTTRGIRPASPAALPPAISVQPAATHAVPRPAPALPAATAEPVQPATAAAKAPSVNLTVQFQNGSAELTPAAVQALNELGRALSSTELSQYRFRVEGHTDTVGTPALNMTLSDRRAARVADYLETKFGIASSRLEAVGRGSEDPLVPTPAQTAEPRNRRVQVVNLGGA